MEELKDKMKVLSLNSSARTGDVSKTEILLDCLVEGMRDGGADVEVVNLRKKNQILYRLFHLLDQNSRHMHPQG